MVEINSLTHTIDVCTFQNLYIFQFVFQWCLAWISSHSTTPPVLKRLKTPQNVIVSTTSGKCCQDFQCSNWPHTQNSWCVVTTNQQCKQYQLLSLKFCKIQSKWGCYLLQYMNTIINKNYILRYITIRNKLLLNTILTNKFNFHIFFCKKCKKWRHYIRWFKYDQDCLHLFTYKLVPVIFEPPCN